MRRSILLAVGLFAASAMTVPVEADVRSYWDQSAGKWVKYDEHGQVDRGTNRGGSSIRRQTVRYDGPFPANTIVVNTKERRLYYVMSGDKALKYGIGVGREGFQWSGTNRISRKAEWPGWTPPPEMIARERKKGRILPAYMPGGPRNPLGARALYIGDTLYRIHGSNEPWTIGRAVSSGCIRLTNDDIVDLYNRVKVGTRVVVLHGNESAVQLRSLARPAAPKPKATAVAASGDKPAPEATAAAGGEAAATETAAAAPAETAAVETATAPAEAVAGESAEAPVQAASAAPAEAVVEPEVTTPASTPIRF